MKTLLQNSEKERDKYCLLFKTSFMKHWLHNLHSSHSSFPLYLSLQ